MSAAFSGAKGGLDSVKTVLVIVFGINVWPFKLFDWFAIVWLF